MPGAATSSPHAFRAVLAGAVGLVSGDQVVAEQLQASCPWVEAVVVKEALGNQAGNCLAPPRAREMIDEAAARVVEKAAQGSLPVYRDEPAPYELEVEMRSAFPDALRDNLAAMPEFETVGDRCVRIMAPDMDLGFRRVAYLGYGNRPGLTRY